MGTNKTVRHPDTKNAGTKIHSRTTELMINNIVQPKYTQSEQIKQLLDIVDEAIDADRNILLEAERLKASWDEWRERKRVAVNVLKNFGVILKGVSDE